MDLKQLNTFAMVARLGSLSKAAARLRIAQPALSRQIRMLEDEMGMPLFSRHGRGMELNEAGQLLLVRANAILQQVADIKTDLVKHASEVQGKVVLGIPPTVGDAISGRIVERFMGRYPQVRLRIVPAFTDYLFEWLQRGEIDIAIMYAHEKQHELKTCPLIMENLFLIGSANDGLQLHEAVEFSDLANLRLVLPGPTHSLRHLVEKEAAISNIELDIPVEADALQTLKDLCRRGLGYTILPLGSVHEEVLDGVLSAAPLIEPSLCRKLILAQPLGRAPSNAIEKFAEELQAEVKDMVNTGVWNGQLLTA